MNHTVIVGDVFKTKIQAQESDGSTGNPANPISTSCDLPGDVSIVSSGQFNELVTITFLAPTTGSQTAVVTYSDGNFTTTDVFNINPKPVVEDGLVSIPQ